LTSRPLPRGGPSGECPGRPGEHRETETDAEIRGRRPGGCRRRRAETRADAGECRDRTASPAPPAQKKSSKKDGIARVIDFRKKNGRHAAGTAYSTEM